jgi:hypothetical protein
MTGYCPSCVKLNLPCIFPENSEQCRQCQDSQRRCEGSTSPEEYQRIADELEEVQDQMDAILEDTIQKPDSFRYMKQQLRALEEEKQSRRLGRHEKTQRREEEQILSAMRQLHRSLTHIRQHHSPENPHYHALQNRQAALEKRQNEILRRSEIWLNEVLDMTDYSHYRGLPMPENLDEAQWKTALAWAQAYPGSHADYPSPSSICDESDHDEEVIEASDSQIRTGFRQPLRDFYPFFDMLVRLMTVAKEEQSAHEHSGVALTDNAVSVTRSDIVGIKTGVDIVQAHVDYLRKVIDLAKQHSLNDSPSTSQTFNIDEKFRAICRDLLSVSSMVTQDKVLNSASQDEASSSLESTKELHHGLNEVERYLSKLRLTTLLLPEEALPPNFSANESFGIQRGEHEMDTT